jgi:hypothetical protein
MRRGSEKQRSDMDGHHAIDGRTGASRGFPTAREEGEGARQGGHRATPRVNTCVQGRSARVRGKGKEGLKRMRIEIECRRARVGGAGIARAAACRAAGGQAYRRCSSPCLTAPLPFPKLRSLFSSSQIQTHARHRHTDTRSCPRHPTNPTPLPPRSRSTSPWRRGVSPTTRAASGVRGRMCWVRID